MQAFPYEAKIKVRCNSDEVQDSGVFIEICFAQKVIYRR